MALLAVALLLGFVPAIVAHARQHGYVPVICVGCVLAMALVVVVCFTEVGSSIGLAPSAVAWVGMMVWSVWPTKKGRG